YGHEGPGLVAPAPAELLVVEASERVEQRVEIRADGEAEMLEIVAVVGDDGQPSRRQHIGKAECQLRTADTAGEREHAAVGIEIGQVAAAHRNRSSAAGRISAVAGSAATSPGSSP